MKRPWSRLLIPGLCLLAACAGSDKLPEGPLGTGRGDGGPSGRTILDGGSDGGRDAKGNDPIDAPTSALPEGVTVDVSFPDIKDMPVSAADTTFMPALVVKVTSTLAAPPSVRSVSLEVWLPDTIAPATRVNLEALSAPVVEDKNAITYKFGNILVSLAALKSGLVELRAIVEMTNASQVEKAIKIRVDAGPVIKVLKPKENESFKGSARIEVSISDALFMPIKDVAFLLGSTALTVEEPESGVYAATVDFASFSPPLSGAQLVTVRAKNSNNTQSVAPVKFLADNVGPTFESLTPTLGQLIGGLIEVSAVVKDPAEVEPTSVVAIIANGSDASFEVRLNPPPPGSMEQKYSRDFDAKLLRDNAIFPTVSFRASDKLGNESTVGFLVSLDNMPPVTELDPPGDFRFNVNFSNELKCSWPFDPVGPDAVDDGQLVNQAFDVRVRAEDQGNQVVSGNIDFIPIAGVKKVDLLVLDDSSRALVVDTDGDAKCDAMNPLLVPTTRPMGANDILLLGLVPLPPQGTPDNFPETPQPAMCTSGGLNDAVSPLCGSFGPTLVPWKARYQVLPNGGLALHGHFMSVFPHYTQSKLPSIWAPGPILGGVECAGRQLETVGSNIQDGWACIAALSEDNLGQKQVSKPIRVCVDHDGDGQDCPHRKIVSVSHGTPIEIRTTIEHGLTTGNDVIIQGVLCQTHANGQHRITVTGPTTFSLDSVATRTDYLGSVSACSSTKAQGWVVATAELPDCTGRQTEKEPTVKVDNAASCSPWRSFGAKELRTY